MNTTSLHAMDPIDALGERIAETAAQIDSATHRFLADIRAFDDAEGWHRQGALSCAKWLLNWRCGIDLGAAREKVRVAHALAKLPAVDEALRRALQIRDGGCRFPGCQNRMVDGHHVIHWADGGETNLENTVLLCRRHHVMLHEGGFAMTGTPDTGLTFFARSGKPIVAATLALPLFDYGVHPLRARALTDGIEIQPLTNLPHWDGAQPDYEMAVSAALGH